MRQSSARSRRWSQASTVAANLNPLWTDLSQDAFDYRAAGGDDGDAEADLITVCAAVPHPAPTPGQFGEGA